MFFNTVTLSKEKIIDKSNFIMFSFILDFMRNFPSSNYPKSHYLQQIFW